MAWCFKKYDVRITASLRILAQDMQKLVVAIFLSFSILSCQEELVQEPVQTDATLKVDYQYRPLIHHFSSTGCGPCGSFGIPVISQIADQMGDSILPLITHFKYNDPFITESSKAIESAILNQWYSPQIWIENSNITYDIIYDNIPVAVDKASKILRKKISNNAEAYVGVKAALNTNQRYDLEYLIENGVDDSATYFVEVYAMEDSIVASQAGANPFVSTHYRVNRGGFYGGMGLEVKLAGKEKRLESLEFVPCWVCDPLEQYFYIIVWKEVSAGRFEYVNGKVLRL